MKADAGENYFNLEEGKKVRLFLRDEREEILDKYAGIVKLGRTVKLKEILTLGKTASSND